MKKDVVVTVVIITYNHEKFIEQAIDSVLMQKVNFNYEVLIGNDCSPDNTKNILLKYEKYDFFKIFNRPKNMGANKNSCDLLKRAKGKYVAFLEGDDYWTDENKLQKQVDFLENHQEYIGVAHRQNVVDINGKYIKTYEEWSKRHSKKYTKKDVEKGNMFFQGNALMVKNFYKDNDFSFIYKIDPLVGDRSNLAFFTSFGDIYILNDNMSVYRWFEKPERKRELLEDSIHSLEYYTKLEKIVFPNNQTFNFQSYKNRLIANYYFFSILRIKKIDWKKSKNLKKYTNLPIMFIIIIVFFKYLFVYIGNFFWKIYKKIGELLCKKN